MGGPQVGPEDFIADSGRRHATVEQRRPDEPHERQRTARKGLNVVRERNVGQVHEALARAGVAFIDGFVPRIGGEVVDLSSEMQHGFSQGVILSSAIGVGGMMGAGLYTLVGLASTTAGVWVPLAFLVGGAVSVFSVYS